MANKYELKLIKVFSNLSPSTQPPWNVGIYFKSQFNARCITYCNKRHLMGYKEKLNVTLRFTLYLLHYKRYTFYSNIFALLRRFSDIVMFLNAQ